MEALNVKARFKRSQHTWHRHQLHVALWEDVLYSPIHPRRFWLLLRAWKCWLGYVEKQLDCSILGSSTVCLQQLALPLAASATLAWLPLSRLTLAAGSCSSKVAALGAIAPSSVAGRAEGGLAEAAAPPCNHFLISIYIFSQCLLANLAHWELCACLFWHDDNVNLTSSILKVKQLNTWPLSTQWTQTWLYANDQLFFTDYFVFVIFLKSSPHCIVTYID